MTDPCYITCPRCGTNTHEVLGPEVIGQSLVVRALGKPVCFDGVREGTDMLCYKCGEAVARSGMVHFKQGWSKATSVISIGHEMALGD